MGWFVASIILGIISVILITSAVLPWLVGNTVQTLIVGRVGNTVQTLIVGSVCLLLGIGCFLLSITYRVPKQNVGIVTEFGVPTGKTTGPGLHTVKPWESIDNWDGTLQTWDRLGKNCVNVRIASLANSCVELKIQWRVRNENAPTQFADYKGDFGNFVINGIEVNFLNVINDVFATYDPLALIDKTTGNLNVDLQPYTEHIVAKVKNRIGADATVVSVNVIRVNHDDKTERNIKVYRDKLLENRNLKQDLTNAELKRQISGKNAQVDKVTRCLEIAQASGKEPGWCLNPGFAFAN